MRLATELFFKYLTAVYTKDAELLREVFDELEMIDKEEAHAFVGAISIYTKTKDPLLVLRFLGDVSKKALKKLEEIEILKVT